MAINMTGCYSTVQSRNFFRMSPLQVTDCNRISSIQRHITGKASQTLIMFILFDCRLAASACKNFESNLMAKFEIHLSFSSIRSLSFKRLYSIKVDRKCIFCLKIQKSSRFLSLKILKIKSFSNSLKSFPLKSVKGIFVDFRVFKLIQILNFSMSDENSSF